MEILIFLVPWVLIGLGVIFVAYTGGPSGARQAYLTRGNKPFRLAMVLLYVAFGIAIPAYVIANRGEAVGATGSLANEDVSGQVERGKALFLETCSSCHSLGAANAQGNTGPNLDQIGAVNKARIIEAIKNGGTGQDRMPAGLLDGANADAVAAYVAKVAGR